MKRALLFRLGGLGDLLVAFPAIYLVRKKFPSAHLTLVGREEYAGLLREAAVVNQTARGDAPRLAPLYSDDFNPDAGLTDWLQGFDLILGWLQERKKGQLERNLLSLGPRECRFFNYDPRRLNPVSRFFFEETAGALERRSSAALSFEECSVLPLRIGPGNRKNVSSRGEDAVKRFVVIHPGSGGETKCWPLPQFLDIVGRLGQHGINGVLVTGEAEARMEEVLARFAFPGGWSWLRCPSLMALAGLLLEAGLYLGNDSGITHLAAACGTETVALFRRDLETAWRPYGRVHLLSAPSLGAISLDSVWRLMADLLRLS